MIYYLTFFYFCAVFLRYNKKNMAEKFGRTWWGEHWLQSLKNVDYGNRLPCGATYARTGRVKKIDMLTAICLTTCFSVTSHIQRFSNKELREIFK